MGFEAERAAIESLFASGFTAAPVRFDNVAFSEPANGIFVSLTILNAMSARRAIGINGRNRHVGTIAVQVFVPKTVGSSPARALADAVVAVLQEQTISAGTDTIYTFTSRCSPGGVVGNNRYAITVFTTYNRDELN